MGWFNDLTGFETPKFLKDFDDNFMTPAINSMVKTAPVEYQIAYQGSKQVAHSMLSDDPVKTLQPIVKSQAQIIQENLEKQLNAEYEAKKKELELSLANMSINKNDPVKKVDNSLTIGAGLLTSFLLFR